MSENTKDWNVTLTINAYLEYTVQADDEESAIAEAVHQFETTAHGNGEGDYYDLDLGEEIIGKSAYLFGMY